MLTYSLHSLFAGVAEQADARDLKSREVHTSYRFDPGHRHQKEGHSLECPSFCALPACWLYAVLLKIISREK